MRLVVCLCAVQKTKSYAHCLCMYDFKDVVMIAPLGLFVVVNESLCSLKTNVNTTSQNISIHKTYISLMVVFAKFAPSESPT